MLIEDYKNKLHLFHDQAIDIRNAIPITKVNKRSELEKKIRDHVNSLTIFNREVSVNRKLSAHQISIITSEINRIQNLFETSAENVQRLASGEDLLKEYPVQIAAINSLDEVTRTTNEMTAQADKYTKELREKVKAAATKEVVLKDLKAHNELLMSYMCQISIIKNVIAKTFYLSPAFRDNFSERLTGILHTSAIDLELENSVAEEVARQRIEEDFKDNVSAILYREIKSVEKVTNTETTNCILI